MASLNATDQRNTVNQAPQYQTEMLENGDIYFFYRPMVGSEEVNSIDDVRRFFMITAPEEGKQDGKKKHLYRLFVIGKKSLPGIRKSEARTSERYWARVAGIFEDPIELTIPAPTGYPSTEEPPKYPEEVLKELSNAENFIPLSRDTKLIDYQYAQIILIGAREGQDIIKNETGVEINKDKNHTQESSSADIFTKLKVRKEQVPTKPLIEGKLE